jgi:hypothetical protein
VIQCNGCGSCCRVDFPYRFTSTSDKTEVVITRNGKDYHTMTKVGAITVLKITIIDEDRFLGWRMKDMN